MENIIAVVSNRNYALQFATYLKRNGVKNKIIDTPRELSSSCGISVVFDIKALQFAKQLLVQLRINSFVKLYKVSKNSFQKYYSV